MAPKKTTAKKPKKWMQSAVSNPGAATRAAKAEGMSVQAWAQKHKGDPGVKGERARLAITFKKAAKK